MIFHRFLVDFKRISGGFWEDFSKIFCVFLENADFVKNGVFLRKIAIFKGSSS